MQLILMSINSNTLSHLVFPLMPYTNRIFIFAERKMERKSDIFGYQRVKG